MVIKKAVTSFIHYISYIEPKSKATIEAYTHDLITYQDFLEKQKITDLNTLTFDHINRYIILLSENYEISTVQRKVVTLRQFHQYTQRLNITTIDPTQFLTLKNKGKRLPSLVSKESLKKLMVFEDTHQGILERVIFLLLFHCGLRVSECCNLTFNQVYLDEKWLRIVGKRNKERMVPMSDEVVEALKRYIETVRPLWLIGTTDKILINSKGKPIVRQSVHNMIKSKCKKEGIYESISAHSLRHSFASSILDQGVDLRTIQELLGHADIATTQIYTHLNDDSLKRDYDSFLKGGFSPKGDKENE